MFEFFAIVIGLVVIVCLAWLVCVVIDWFTCHPLFGKGRGREDWDIAKAMEYYKHRMPKAVLELFAEEGSGISLPAEIPNEDEEIISIAFLALVDPVESAIDFDADRFLIIADDGCGNPYLAELGSDDPVVYFLDFECGEIIRVFASVSDFHRRLRDADGHRSPE